MQALKTSAHVSSEPSSSLVSETGKRVSEETYWKEYYEHPDFNYEWNNGFLEEKRSAARPLADYLRF